MLEFVVGRSGSGKTQRFLEEIQKRLSVEPMGNPIFLLTPAHLTYKLEKDLALLLGDEGGGFFRAQVVSFQRLAHYVLSKVGGGIHPLLTSMGKTLLLKKSLTTKQESLKFFNKVSRQRGFVTDLADVISEFKGAQISPDHLAEIAKKIKDDVLREKIEDITLIYDKFKEEISGKFNDAEDILDILVRKISIAEFLGEAEIWIDGFVLFNQQELRIIEELLKKVKNIHISLLYDVENEKNNILETSIFHTAWEMKNILTRMAENLNKEIKVTPLLGIKRYNVPALKHLEKELFALTPQKNFNSEGIKIIEAADSRCEIEEIAIDMLRLSREEGYCWNEIGVLLRNVDDYGFLPAMIFSDYGIPYFSDFKRPGVHHPLAELIRSIFEVARRWQYEPIFRALKTGFFPVTRDEIDILENYVLSFGIKDAQWTMLEDWTWIKHYNDLENNEIKLTKREVKFLAEINDIRRRIVNIFEKFIKSFKVGRTAKEKSTALYEFLLMLEVPQKLELWASEAETQGRLADARLNHQIWTNIIELMEQLVMMSGENAMSWEECEYEQIFEEGLDSLTIALIPPGLDYVTISSFDRNSLRGTRALYIIGANDGVLPRHSQEKGLLSDADRLRLNEMNLPIHLGARKDSYGERNIIYRGFVTGSDYLCMSYPLVGRDGKALTKSVYITKLLENVFPSLEVFNVGLEKLGNLENGFQLATKKQAIASLATVFEQYFTNRSPMGYWQDVYNCILDKKDLSAHLDLVLKGVFMRGGTEKISSKVAKLLFTENGKLKGSVSRFEGFRKCPFMHFINYGLNLKERDIFKYEAHDHGTFLHAIMAQFGEELKKENKQWQSVTEDECHERCQRIVNDLATRMRNEIFFSTHQKKNQLERIAKTAEKSLLRLIEFDKISCFKPTFFECGFGMEKNSFAPIEFKLSDDFTLLIRGKIDRIDKSLDGKYYLVIDYKTGNESIDLGEVYDGVRLQLLTYLLLAKNIMDEESISVGALYFFLKDIMISGNERLNKNEIKEKVNNSLKMPGWLLKDSAIIKLVDESGKFIAVTLKNDGEINERTKKYQKTKDEFNILLNYLEEVLKETAEKILSGEIKALPYSNGDKFACQYCKYRAICGFDEKIIGFKRREGVKLGEKELIEKMEKKGGY